MAREKDDSVQAICTNGHVQQLWGNPLVAKDGERVNFWGSAFNCGQCGAPVYGGGRPKSNG